LTAKYNLFILAASVTPRKLFNFYIDPDLAEGLKRLKEVEHESEGAIARRAIRRYLEGRGVIKAVKRSVRAPRKA
jgi:hypothetical protein